MSAVSHSARAAVLVAAGLMAASGAASAAPAAHSEARAAKAAPAHPYGKVLPDRLSIRQYPSTDSAVKRIYLKGKLFGIDCKVRAQYVYGNTYWYKLRGLERWASARYVKNYGSVPLCKDKFPTRMTNSEAARNAMG